METIVEYSSPIMAVATIVLAFATIKLWLHTKTLAKVTERLEAIEKRRDEVDRKQRIRSDISEATRLALSILPMFASTIKSEIQHSFDPEKITAVLTLNRFGNYLKYFDDPEGKAAYEFIMNELRKLFRREKGITFDVTLVQGRLETLKAGLERVLPEWKKLLEQD